MKMRLNEEALLTALQAWPLPSPHLVRRLPAGFTSEVWLVEAGGAHFVAKYADQPQEALEAGLFAAELAERYGITSGAPLRTKEGALSLLVEEPYGQRHPLALLRFVEGSPLNVTEPGAASLYGQCSDALIPCFRDSSSRSLWMCTIFSSKRRTMWCLSPVLPS